MISSEVILNCEVIFEIKVSEIFGRVEFFIICLENVDFNFKIFWKSNEFSVSRRQFCDYSDANPVKRPNKQTFHTHTFHNKQNFHFIQ